MKEDIRELEDGGPNDFPHGTAGWERPRSGGGSMGLSGSILPAPTEAT